MTSFLNYRCESDLWLIKWNGVLVLIRINATQSAAHILTLSAHCEDIKLRHQVITYTQFEL